MRPRDRAWAVAAAAAFGGCTIAGEEAPPPAPVPQVAGPDVAPPAAAPAVPAPESAWAPVLDSESEWIRAVKERQPSSWASFEPDPHFVFLYDRKVKESRIREMAAEVVRLLRETAVPTFPPAKPLDRVFLFRICRDEDQFNMYGGPPGAAGYWSPFDRECVTYEDRSARKDALRRLRYVAMMQYLDLAGAPWTHPWFRTGVATAFAEPGPRRVLKANRDWAGRARAARAAGRLVPVHDLLGMEEVAFLGQAEPDRRAQAWSLAWFLLRTRDPRWAGALQKYFLAHRDRLAGEPAADPLPPPLRVPLPEETIAAARAAGLRAAFGELDSSGWAGLETAMRKTR